MVDLENAKLVPQSYGIAMAQNNFGGPRGIWLECKGCPTSEKIAGSGSDEWIAQSDETVAAIFRRHGWTGEGDRMMKAHCPACSASKEPMKCVAA